MTIKRLIILQAVMLAGLSLVFAVPRNVRLQPAGIELALPAMVGEWYGEDKPVSQGERDSLGPDTEFARKSYTNGRGDELYVSVVLSGPDMNTSIHRPERCIPAQGWTIADSRTVPCAVNGAGSPPINLTRLHNLRPIQTTDGQSRNIYNLNYYWFVGSNDITASHFERAWIDIRDRVLRGYNQRWAYVTVASTITRDLQRFGRSEDETDQIIQGFVRQLLPLLQAKQSVKREMDPSGNRSPGSSAYPPVEIPRRGV